MTLTGYKLEPLTYWIEKYQPLAIVLLKDKYTR